MKPSTIEILRCPRCRAGQSLQLTVEVADAREVREGGLVCGCCAQRYPIREGIVELWHDPPDFVLREAAGLERFAEVMRNDGWDQERILALPQSDDGYWFTQALSMEALLASGVLKPGARILDVGSNACWASNILARHGLDVFALDIALAELQGLRTAEYFIGSGEVYFERILSVMFDLPFADESLDYVFCSEVLHHNDKPNLHRTMREIYRVLRPSGSLLLINEPMRFLLNLKREHGLEVAAYDGHEHIYFLHEYYLAIRRAGFQITVNEPPAEKFFHPWTATIGPQTPIRVAARMTAAHIVRSHALGRRLMLAYKSILTGDVTLNLIATKP